MVLKQVKEVVCHLGRPLGKAYSLEYTPHGVVLRRSDDLVWRSEESQIEKVKEALQSPQGLKVEILVDGCDEPVYTPPDWSWCQAELEEADLVELDHMPSAW